MISSKNIKPLFFYDCAGLAIMYTAYRGNGRFHLWMIGLYNSTASYSQLYYKHHYLVVKSNTVKEWEVNHYYHFRILFQFCWPRQLPLLNPPTVLLAFTMYFKSDKSAARFKCQKTRQSIDLLELQKATRFSRGGDSVDAGLCSGIFPMSE